MKIINITMSVFTMVNNRQNYRNKKNVAKKLHQKKNIKIKFSER